MVGVSTTELTRAQFLSKPMQDVSLRPFSFQAEACAVKLHCPGCKTRRTVSSPTKKELSVESHFTTLERLATHFIYLFFNLYCCGKAETRQSWIRWGGADILAILKQKMPLSPALTLKTKFKNRHGRSCTRHVHGCFGKKRETVNGTVKNGLHGRNHC
ncbi:UNVERIFIED_CONTAM: hypothetical protein K2H54_059030 [Gekko kuhli]